MKVQNIQNNNYNTNFGLRILTKNEWNPKVLNALQNSNLLKEIDAKYPKATTYCDYICPKDIDPTLVKDKYISWFSLWLDNSKRFVWAIIGNNPSESEEHLAKSLKTLTLSEVEQDAMKKHSPISTIKITELN